MRHRPRFFCSYKSTGHAFASPLPRLCSLSVLHVYYLLGPFDERSFHRHALIATVDYPAVEAWPNFKFTIFRPPLTTSHAAHSARRKQDFGQILKKHILSFYRRCCRSTEAFWTSIAIKPHSSVSLITYVASDDFTQSHRKPWLLNTQSHQKMVANRVPIW